jgi:acyl carrier protein
MRRLFPTLMTISLVAFAFAPAAMAQERATAQERIRTELAKLLKKEPAQLPVDRPVTTLGADELTVVEWQMACEKAFRVDIDNDKLFDPEAKGAPRKDLTVASMARIVANSKPWPAGKTK